MILDPHEPRAWRDEPNAPWMIAVSGGEFMMGASPDDKFANDTERPTHRVSIAPFALGRFPVTVGEYRAFSPSHAPEDDSALPFVGVRWDEARAYCDWLSGVSSRPYRLPTEAEWEFSCRAGSAAPFACGWEMTPRDANFYYSESSERVGPGRRTSCGAYPANAFGIHDLHGNVGEWIEDSWHADYHGAPADGSAWSASGDGERRVVRGGAWDYLPRLLRSSWRDALPRETKRDNLGFRIAASLV